MKLLRAAVQVTGQVQGVNFRASAKRQAEALGLSGWVRNLPDGTVEVDFEGPEAAVHQMVEWCSHGPQGAWVDLAEVEWLDALGNFSGFEVRG